MSRKLKPRSKLSFLDEVRVRGSQSSRARALAPTTRDRHPKISLSLTSHGPGNISAIVCVSISVACSSDSLTARRHCERNRSSVALSKVAALRRVPLPRTRLDNLALQAVPSPFPKMPFGKIQQRRGNRSKPARSRPSDAAVHRQFLKLQVLNTFSSDSTSPSICIHTQTKTYLFNCPEGMQRICMHRSRIPRESHLFLTRVNWDVAGGLPGMSCFVPALT